MPKRKSESDDYEQLFKKFKRLEKKLLRRRCRSRSRSSDNSYRTEYAEPEYSASSDNYEIAENNIAELLDGTTSTRAPRSEVHACNAELAAEPTEQPTAALATTDAATAEPSTSVATTSQLANASPGEESGSAEVILASEILEILGEDPTISNNYGNEIHKDLAVRLEHAAIHGLTKELRKELSEKYLLPSNCKLVDAPALNAEIKAGISDITAKRDKSIEIRQKQVATAISCVGQAINLLISKSDADPAIVKMLMDTERILCDSQHSDSVIRRNFILSTMKKDMKDQLQNNKYKAINKSGAELKTPKPKPQANTNNKKFPLTASTSKNLNWKGPYPPRKHQNHPKTKEPPPNRNRQLNSSRQSHHQRTRDRR